MSRASCARSEDTCVGSTVGFPSRFTSRTASSGPVRESTFSNKSHDCVSHDLEDSVSSESSGSFDSEESSASSVEDSEADVSGAGASVNGGSDSRIAEAGDSDSMFFEADTFGSEGFAFSISDLASAYRSAVSGSDRSSDAASARESSDSDEATSFFGAGRPAADSY